MAELTPYQKALAEMIEAGKAERLASQRQKEAQEIATKRQREAQEIAQSKLEEEEYYKGSFNEENIKAYDEAIAAAHTEYPSEPDKWEDYALNYLKQNAKALGTPYFASLEKLPEEVRSVVKMDYSERRKALKDISAQKLLQERERAAEREAHGLAKREAPVAAQKVSIVPSFVKKALGDVSEAYLNLDPNYREAKADLSEIQNINKEMGAGIGEIEKYNQGLREDIAKSKASTADFKSRAGQLRDQMKESSAMVDESRNKWETEKAELDRIHQANLAQQKQWEMQRMAPEFEAYSKAPKAASFQAKHPWLAGGWVDYVASIPKKEVGPTQEAETKLQAKSIGKLLTEGYKPTAEEKAIAARKIDEELSPKPVAPAEPAPVKDWSVTDPYSMEAYEQRKKQSMKTAPSGGTFE